tara:strand:- start:185 stop:424 length:240 start_codon:yes stop_codon:yes gene_type:complete
MVSYNSNGVRVTEFAWEDVSNLSSFTQGSDNHDSSVFASLSNQEVSAQARQLGFSSEVEVGGVVVRGRDFREEDKRRSV